MPKSPKSLTTTTTTTSEVTPNFEGSVAELAEIVEKLEAGELPLEDALRLFERGMSLVKTSQGILDRAERKVEQLLGFDENGRPITQNLEEDVDESR